MSRVSLSFLVDTMDKRRGGCAPNIAYTLALLGERPRLMATAGQDFGDYRHWLEAAGVDTSLVQDVPGQVHRVVLLQHRSESNQIASFYTGAMANAAELSFRTVDELRAGDHLAERSGGDAAVRRRMPGAGHSRTSGIRVSSARGCRASELQAGLVGADLVICNDYELELMRQKTGLDEDGILAQARALVVTQRRARVLDLRGRRPVRMCRPCRPSRIVDPTGVGDAFRGGFMKGMARGADIVVLGASSAPSRPPMRSSISAARATPTPGRSSVRGSTSILAGSATSIE